MGVCDDPGSYRWCQALSRSRSSFATNQQKTKSKLHQNHNLPNESNYLQQQQLQKQQQPQQQPQHNHKLCSILRKTTTTTSISISKNNNNNDQPTNILNKKCNKFQESQELQKQKQKQLRVSKLTFIKNIKIITSNILCCELLKSLQLFSLVFVIFLAKTTTANIPEDAVHITAILGEGVIFNCHVEFPNDHPVPYVLQWDKKVSETGSDLPIYIWYESYPEHIEEGYKGRVSRVSLDSPFGSASLNLTNIKESDQGWYECKVVFLNRDPKQHKNGTWFHLDVHAPPRFSVTPEDIIYVNLGDSIILNCQADGTPTPEILWYKDANPVDPSPTVGIFNDGTELRISSIRHEDIGEYTCIARNGEGQVSHTARVIIAGGAVIMVPPTNQTKLEGEKVAFTCEAKAMPGNVTVRWFREGVLVREIPSIESRVTIRKDGTLMINPVAADDSGMFLCEVTNGIGDPQSASAYLNVEFPAKVTFTPTVQYLPHKLAGVVQCYIKSNPTLQYVTWTKDKRLLEPYQMKDIVVMANGSLLFTQVNEDHQGRYTCTPYNAQGTQGSSGTMEVLVRKPPVFTVEPESLYQRRVGEAVEMHCDAIESEGTQRPSIKWQRQDGSELTDSQRNRVRISGGNLTIENLRREDFGYYQCLISNEVATLMATAQLVIEGTQPHAPYNITGKATESSITLQWVPGYSGGSDYKQEYTIWFREQGAGDWQTIPVTPPGNTEITMSSLASGTNYEFQVIGRNVLGDGIMSKILTVRTLEDAPAAPRNVKAATQPPDHVFQLMPDDAGPKPGPPRNLSVTEVYNGFLISWQSPLERAHIVKFYTIKYRTDAQWKTLNRGQIRPEETQYLVKNLVGGRTYYFRVLANSEKSYESSDEVKFPVPARVKHKAITAGVVGGILFFIVAIILSVCAVKICNKRKRRKQEKEFNMVACRITDARNIATNNHHLNHHNHHHQNQLHLQNHNTGSISGGQVPLKKYKQTRVSSLTTILIAILHWIWPPDRCSNCHSIYSSPHMNDAEYGRSHSVSQIRRSVDGRFLPFEAGSLTKVNALTNSQDDIDEVDSEPRQRRNSNLSQHSSSDDGGFLSRRNFLTARASWRRPLVASPSQLSLHSAAESTRGFLQGLAGGLLKLGSAGGGSHTLDDDLNSHARYQNVYRTNYGQNIYRNLNSQSQTLNNSRRPLHINTLHNTPRYHSSNVTNLYTPSRVSRLFSSSPASSPNGMVSLSHHHTNMPGDLVFNQSPWALTSPNYNGSNFQQQHFSDLSTVYPSSAERSLPNTTGSGGNLSRYRYYAQELPALRTIQEETRRMNEQHHQQHQQEMEFQNNFVALELPPSSPSWRHAYYQGPHYSGALGPYHSYRPRTRWYPRHYARLFGRSQSELMSPLPHLNLRSASAIGGLGLDASPESRSSSSGFGSKNNSHQPHGSHHSGSTSEWRLLPPYIAPPPPPAHNSAYFGTLAQPQQPLEQPPQLAQPQAQVPHQQTAYGSATLPLYQHTTSSSSGTNYYGSSLGRPLTPPYTMSHWLDMISRLNAATDSVHLPKSVDVGSVDGHYEFDPATPTPSASTPTGGLLREDFNLHVDTTGHHHTLPVGIFHTSSSGMPPLVASSHTFSGFGSTNRPHARASRYDDIESRLQAMKEEFYAYRKRQAIKRNSVAAEFESIC